MRAEVWGILNVTPDSFSDGGRFVDPGAAIAHARRMRAQGADVIDVGGESTRPGAEPLDPAEEQRRILPVVTELVREGMRVSVDTIHAATARAAMAAGAEIINDVTAGLHDPEMLPAVAEGGARIVLMHSRGIDVTADTHYDDVVAEVLAHLASRVEAAVAAGIPRERIILDPGFGFSKGAEDNWRLLASTWRFWQTRLPVLVGTSRKRFLGALLPDGARVEERDAATAATSVLAVQKGAAAVRVHDVASTVAALRALDAMERGERDGQGSTIAGWPSGEPGVAHGTAVATAQAPLDEAALAADAAIGAMVAAQAARSAVHGRIELRGIRARGHHGVLPQERRDGQEFVIDAMLELELTEAVASDDVASTVHYGELAQAIVAAVERDPVDLIETLADRIVDVCLQHERVAFASVTVHKPSAPIGVPFADVAVTIHRGRSQS